MVINKFPFYEGDGVGSYSLTKLPFLGKTALVSPSKPTSQKLNSLSTTNAKKKDLLNSPSVQKDNVEPKQKSHDYDDLPAIVKTSKEISDTNSSTIKFNNLHIKYTDFFPLDIILVSKIFTFIEKFFNTKR